MKTKLAMLTNIKKIINKKRTWATLLVVQILLFYLLSKSKTSIIWLEKIFEVLKSFHQKLFSWIPFSIGDVFYIVLGLFLVIILFKIFKKNKRNKAIVTLLMLVNILYFIYQIFWGMLYFQTPIISKLSKEEPTLEETKNIALKYLRKASETRKLVSEDKNGVFKIKKLSEIETEILSQQTKINVFGLEKPATGIHSFKPSLYGNVMSYSGILGYYNPFTAEAQYNTNLPSTYLPFTLAHESAHQLGFAREHEANFIAYLIGVNSSNIELRLSTEWHTFKSLLNAIYPKDEKFVNQLIDSLPNDLKRDLKAEEQFRKKHEGVIDDFFGVTNDLFLKSNQQEGSITYSYFVELLIRYERTQK